MSPRPSRLLRRTVAAATAALLGALLAASGCSSKMDEQQCSKIRQEAFDAINKAQPCVTDADCRQSDWPGCAKPVSTTTYEKVKPSQEQFKKGQCEEKDLGCKPPPPAYCKQGLCAHKQEGREE